MVIADLSYKNPNVFYELGIRHCRKLGTILICQDKKRDIVFDTKDDSTFQYNPMNKDEFVRNMRNAIKHVEEHPFFVDSNVGDYLKIDYLRNYLDIDICEKRIHYHKDSKWRYGGLAFQAVLTNNKSINVSIRDIKLYINSTDTKNRFGEMEIFDHEKKSAVRLPLNIESGHSRSYWLGFYFVGEIREPKNPSPLVLDMLDGTKQKHSFEIIVGDLQLGDTGILVVYPVVETKRIS